MERDARGAERIDHPRHVEVAGDGEDVRAVGAHRVHHAEGVGRVAEVREVARQDRAVGFAEHGAEPLDGLKGHVDVTEADEAHQRACSCRPTTSQRAVPRCLGMDGP